MPPISLQMTLGVKILFIVCYFTGVAVEVSFSGQTIPIRTVDLLVPLVFAWLVKQSYNQRRHQCNNSQIFQYNVAIFLVLIVSMAGALYSVSRERVLLLSAGFVSGIVAYNLFACLPVARLRGTNEAIVLMRMLGAGVIINVVYIYFESRAGDAEGYYEYKNLLVNSFGGSNWFASLLAYCFTYELFNSGRRIGRIVWALAYIITLIMTMSKGGGVVVAAALIWKFATVKTSSKVIWTLALFIVAILAHQVFLDHGFKPAEIDVFSDSLSTYESSRFGRMELWQMAWAKFRESPIIGHGINYGDDPHNLILRILRDYGIILGSIVMYWIILPLIQKTKRQASSDWEAFKNSYIILLAHSMVEPQFLSHGSFIWVCMTQGILHSTTKVAINYPNVRKLKIVPRLKLARL